jgi:hypothetical protein
MYLATNFFSRARVWLFLLGRQSGESRHFRTVKLSERVCPSACCKVQKHYLGSWTPVSNLKLCPVQSSAYTTAQNNPQMPSSNHQSGYKQQTKYNLKDTRKNPKVQTLLQIPCCSLCWPLNLQATSKDSIIIKNSQIGQIFKKKRKKTIWKFTLWVCIVHDGQGKLPQNRGLGIKPNYH